MSAAGKARIIAALKKRWAEYHKATEQAKPAAKAKARGPKKAAAKKASAPKPATPPPAA